MPSDWRWSPSPARSSLGCGDRRWLPSQWAPSRGPSRNHSRYAGPFRTVLSIMRFTSASVLGTCTYVGFNSWSAVCGDDRVPGDVRPRGLAIASRLVVASLPRESTKRHRWKAIGKTRREIGDVTRGKPISRRRQAPLRHHSRCARLLAVCADHPQHRAGDGRPQVATSVMNIAVSITALFSGIFIVVIGGLADRVGRVKI